MTKARKEHRCCLCHEPIPVHEDYVYRRLTPWDTDNDDFCTYKTHIGCDQIFSLVGHEFEMQLPNDPGEWRDMTAHYEWLQRQKVGEQR